MRPRAARGDVPFIVDLAIAVALLFSVAFFIIVAEFRIGRGELTAAEMRLLRDDARVVHLHPTSTIGSHDNHENQGGPYGQ